MYEYKFTAPVLRQFKKLSRKVQKRILKKLDFYCQQENPLQFADHLTDPRIGTYRFRVGDYRIVCDLNENALIVLAVGHRREIYR